MTKDILATLVVAIVDTIRVHVYVSVAVSSKRASLDYFDIVVECAHTDEEGGDGGGLGEHGCWVAGLLGCWVAGLMALC